MGAHLPTICCTACRSRETEKIPFRLSDGFRRAEDCPPYHMKEKKLPVIYPTVSFGGLLFVLGAMWYAASSQNSAAAYVLLFTLAGVSLVSIPHTLINLSGVTIAARRSRCRSRS